MVGLGCFGATVKDLIVLVLVCVCMYVGRAGGLRANRQWSGWSPQLPKEAAYVCQCLGRRQLMVDEFMWNKHHHTVPLLCVCVCHIQDSDNPLCVIYIYQLQDSSLSDLALFFKRINFYLVHHLSFSLSI